MTATIPTQEQVDKVAQELAPDVERIRMRVGRDWTDDPALYFRVVLADDASRKDRLVDVTARVKAKLFEELRLAELEHLPYINYRSRSEQAELHDPSWE